MNELVIKIDVLTEVINNLVISIQEEDEKAEKKYLPMFTESMLTTIPAVISAYTRPEFVKVQQDMQYWTGQIKRIMEALTSKDRFLIVDVLKFETVENLLIFREMIKEIEK
jgi:hypothetical protein